MRIEDIIKHYEKMVKAYKADLNMAIICNSPPEHLARFKADLDKLIALVKFWEGFRK